MSNITEIQEIIGYTFKDTGLLERALTHSSSDVKLDGKAFHNERLEFLGDRVLSLVIADKLFKEFKAEREGMLAKRHTALVRKETLAALARTWGLSAFIRMSEGEEQTGGREKDSILSDAVEAILAAIYLDAGYETAQTFVLKHWASVEDVMPLRDAKSRLQELLQKKKKDLPEYIHTETLGDAHSAIFVMQVNTFYGTATGQGSSKQQAEQQAALNLLNEIESIE